MARIDASPTEMANTLRNKMRTVFSMSGQSSPNVRNNRYRQSTELGHLRANRDSDECKTSNVQNGGTKDRASTFNTAPVPNNAQRSLVELDICTRYLFEVVRTGKTQMLSASGNAIVDVLLQLITAVEHERRVLHNTTQIVQPTNHSTKQTPLMKQLHKDMVKLLKWIDRQVMASVIDDDEEHDDQNPSSSQPISTEKHQQQIQVITTKLRATCQALVEGQTDASSDRNSVSSSTSGSSNNNTVPPTKVDEPEYEDYGMTASYIDATLTRPNGLKEIALKSDGRLVGVGTNTPVILSEKDTQRKTDEKALKKSTAEEIMKLNADGSKEHSKHEATQQRKIKKTATSSVAKQFAPINVDGGGGAEDIWSKVKANRHAKEELHEETEDLSDETTESKFDDVNMTKSAKQTKKSATNASKTFSTSTTTSGPTAIEGMNAARAIMGNTNQSTSKKTSSSSSSSSRVVSSSSSSMSSTSAGNWSRGGGAIGGWPANSAAITHVQRLPIIGGMKSGKPTDVDQVFPADSTVVSVRPPMHPAVPPLDLNMTNMMDMQPTSLRPPVPSRGPSSSSNNGSAGGSGGGEWREHVNADGSRVLVKGKEDVRAMKHSDVTNEFEKQAHSVDGTLLALHEGQSSSGEKAALALTQQTVNGEVVDRQGGVLAQKYIDEKEDRQGGNQPPPLPPRKQHVATYMKLFSSNNTPNNNHNSNGDDEYSKRRSANMRRHESMDSKNDADSEACRATLSTYLMLRDNLCRFESQNSPTSRPGERLGAISSSQSTSDIHHTNSMSTTQPAADYKSLRTLLEFGEDDSLRLPLKYLMAPEDSTADGAQLSLGWQTRLAITAGDDNDAEPEEVDLLTMTDVKDYLVIRSSYKQLGEVRGGPLLALIAHCTQPDVTHLLYQEAFITTYRTFVSVSDVLTALVRRYDHFCSNRDETSTQKRSIARHTFAVITRIVDEISVPEMTTSLMTTITQFIYRLMNEGEMGQARLLRQRFTAKLDSKMAVKVSPISSTNKRGSYLQDNFLELKSRGIAEQMTLLDSKMFNLIDLSEMLRWSEKQDEKACPHLVNFTEHFNNVSHWVRTAVLKPAERKDREKYYHKFVKVMRHLRVLGNYNSYLAVLSALDSGAVRRLNWSKDLLESMSEHSSIMDSGHSFRNYRNALALTRPPCLPYIGLILQDLTFIHVGNASNMSASMCNDRKDMINFGKRWQQFAILDAVRKFKQWPYNIEKVEKVQKALRLSNNYTDDEAWLRSEQLKPRKH